MVGQAQIDMFPAVRFTGPERAIFRRRERLKVSSWSEKYVVVTTGPHPGPWRNSTTPYLVDVMDTWALPHVRKVVLCAAPQTGKTSALYNCLGFSADQSPTSMLVVMPDENMAKKISKRRIQPMIDKSPRLSRLKSSNPDDFSALSITLANGATIDLAWARSASALSSMPIEQIYLDETDKYPPFVGQETDPVTLAELRTRTYRWTSRIFQVSSPTIESGFIWRALNDCQEIRDYHVPCIHCGVLQIMDFENIKWPEEVRDPKRIRGDRLAWYECPHCRGRWTDADRDKAVRSGYWEAREPVEHPYSVGFHLSAYVSPFVSLSESAAVWLESKKDKAKARDFANSHDARPWTDYHVERNEDHILELRDDRPRGLVPSDTACLTIAIDTQDLGFYYEVRAWTWGESLESWQIREGYVEAFEDLTKVILDSSYKDSAGQAYMIQFGLIDSQGHRTAEVYDYCRKMKNIWPLKGEQRMNQPWKISHQENYPNGKRMPGGIKLYRINTTYYKDLLTRLLEIAPADPGAWHLHKETTEDYASQMCAEYRDERGLWQCPKHRPNHFWDCAVYNLAAQDIIQVRFWKRPEQQTQRTGRRIFSKGVQL